MDIGVRACFPLEGEAYYTEVPCRTVRLDSLLYQSDLQRKESPYACALESLCSSSFVSVGDFFSDENEAAPALLNHS